MCRSIKSLERAFVRRMDRRALLIDAHMDVVQLDGRRSHDG